MAVSKNIGSPRTGVLHRGPGLLRRQTFAFLQNLEGDIVGRADEGHVTVARRTVDRYPVLLRILAEGVDIIHS